MKKILGFIRQNILFLESLILLAFIPLYPKIPLINIRNTWVYVRAEDFLVALVLCTWGYLFIKKKVSLKTPLTIPILIFWLIGGIATLNGIILIFPTLANVFPNVAFLSYVRHIEYVSLFFVAFFSIRDKKQLKYVVAVLILTLLGVIIYGFGQKYLGFPAFLTSNEEFAKGIPIQLSQLSRVSSTFAGHYDLAAYLVLIIPIIASLIFGIKNLLVKLFLVFVSLASFLLLFWTVSRVSFFAVLAAVFMVLLFQKRKLAIISIVLIGIVAVGFSIYKPALLERLKSTVSNTDVLVDANTGDAVGNVKFVPNSYFKDKIVLQRRVNNEIELVNQMTGQNGEASSSLSAILPFEQIPVQAPLVQAVNVSTGESLPQGTGYINLTLSPVLNKVDNFFYEFPPNIKATLSAQFIVLHGNFIIKRAAAYDLSFTTRFQGEWPRAISTFARNILIGSGYSSVTLAVDNNYLRTLAEIGIVGFASFILIFLSFGIFIKKAWENLTPGLEKSFIVGVVAGIIGLFLNATLIDVFEASKIAYVLWLLIGISLGLVVLSIKGSVNLLFELKKFATSTFAIISYLLGLSFILYSPSLGNFFIGDDFTWLRWAAQSSGNYLSYFINSDGFFYRPGTKIYFDLMYHFFWLNPVVYHFVSLILVFITSALFYLILKRIFKNNIFAALSAFLFLVLSGYSETVLWIAATGILFNAAFGLLGLLFFIKWDESKIKYNLVFSIISFSLALCFHELGVVLPLLVLAYKAKDGLNLISKTLRRKDFAALFIPVIAYLGLRIFANSHWFNGDYSYDLLKLPFNLVGNIVGYVMLIVLGPSSINFYEKIRLISKSHLLIAFVVIVFILTIFYFLLKKFKNYFDTKEKSVVLFGGLFLVVSLLPFLGLGNISSRYSYLATLGVAVILVMTFNKLYGYLISSGKTIAVLSTAVFLLTFSLFHIISLQQTAADWAGASARTNNFFVSFDSLYSNLWSKGKVNLHFVDVPIKNGQAWIFPVGLKDAIWFAVKNDDVNIVQDKDVSSALLEVGNSIRDQIFVFSVDGSISEVQRKINLK